MSIVILPHTDLLMFLGCGHSRHLFQAILSQAHVDVDTAIPHGTDVHLPRGKGGRVWPYSRQKGTRRRWPSGMSRRTSLLIFSPPNVVIISLHTPCLVVGPRHHH